MKKIIALIIVFCFILSICVCVHAQESLLMGADVIGAATYALMSDWGITFSAANATGAGMEGWMNQTLGIYQIEKGHSLGELFGKDEARMLAGQLVIGQKMYNGIKDFVSWMSTKFGLSSSNKSLSQGKYDDMYLPIEMPGDEEIAQTGVSVTFDTQNDYPPWDIGWRHLTVYYNGNVFYEETTSGAKIYEGDYNITIGQDHGNYFLSLAIPYHYYNTGEKRTQTVNITQARVSIVDGLNWNGSQYVEPTVLNPDKAWSGKIGGQDWPDTNLDQIAGKIYDDLSRDLLDVEGDIIDAPPVPEPTPAPIDPDIPLQDVPWEGLNDLLDNTNSTLDSINNEVIRSGQGIDNISGQLDNIGTQIGEQTTSISAAQEATTEAVESLTDTIEGALDVPDSEELSDFKFDLRELFPFCIPFDIYRLLSAFDAQPISPHVQIPFVIESLNFRYNIDLDFSVFDPVAEVLRTMELIAYALGLAWATGKVIKW